MHRFAKVISDPDNNNITVQIQRHSMCEKCGACGTGKQEQLQVSLAANRDLSIACGDVVKVEIPDNAFLLSVFLVYTAPLLVFLCVLGISVLFFTDAYALIIAGAAFVLSFCIIIKIQHMPRLRDYVQPKIVEIIEKNDIHR